MSKGPNGSKAWFVSLVIVALIAMTSVVLGGKLVTGNWAWENHTEIQMVQAPEQSTAERSSMSQQDARDAVTHLRIWVDKAESSATKLAAFWTEVCRMARILDYPLDPHVTTIYVEGAQGVYVSVEESYRETFGAPAPSWTDGVLNYCWVAA